MNRAFTFEENYKKEAARDVFVVLRDTVRVIRDKTNKVTEKASKLMNTISLLWLYKTQM